MLALVAILAAVTGVTLGLLGGGGSILTLPVLVYLLELEVKEAIATSLLVVGVTSACGLVQHARAGNVRWRDGLLFGAVSTAGACAGGLGAHRAPGWLLLGGFATLMMGTSYAMVRHRDRPESNSRRSPAVLGVAALGLGALTGLVGAGGGFLVVPALAILGGLEMRTAVGTSLLVITMSSFAGLAGHLGHVSIDPTLAAIFSAFAAGGALAGAALSDRVAPQRLRRTFAWFLLAMAVLILCAQLSAAS